MLHSIRSLEHAQAEPPQGFELLQAIYVRHTRPDLGIGRGERGTVVDLFEQPRRAYYVEFVNDDGTTRAEGAFTGEELVVPPPGS